MPCSANLKLYGRAAFNRVLHEYKCVACSIEWPPVSEERVRMPRSPIAMMGDPSLYALLRSILRGF